MAAGFLSMGIVAGIAVVCLIIGFLAGRRCRIPNVIKDIAAAAAAAAAKAAAAGDDGDGADDNDADEEDEEKILDEILQNFMSHEWVGGLDDHPETEINPILSYQIKKRKDELRARMELEAQLLARGLEKDHLETLTAEERKAFLLELKGDTTVVLKSNVGSVAGLERKYGRTVNSTLIMQKAGARFTPSANQAAKSLDSSDEAGKKVQQELREKLKAVDSHLSSQEIDVSKVSAKKGGGPLKAGRGLIKSALEVAKDTQFNPHGGAAAKRVEEMRKYAAIGRARVGTPLDHAIAAGAAHGARRASCGASRRASTNASGRRASTEIIAGRRESTEGQANSDAAVEKLSSLA